MANLQDGVALTELGVITRWSLAVRQSEAERAELIQVLKADLAWLEGARVRPAEPGAGRGGEPETSATSELAAVSAADADADGGGAPAKRPAPRPRKTASTRRTPA